MVETHTRPIEILLVEDSAADVRLTVEALKEAKVKNRLNVVDDGVKALAYLNKKGEYANAVQPDLILLDLNLPKKAARSACGDKERSKPQKNPCGGSYGFTRRRGCASYVQSPCQLLHNQTG